MQTIPYSTLGDKKVRYRKPQANRGEIRYKPIRKNKNTWYFPHPIDKNPQKEVYEMGQRYLSMMNNPQTRPRRKLQSPVALVKLLYYISLTGCRQQEPFKKPYPTLKISGDAESVWIEISHANEKQSRENKKNIAYVIPVFNEWEQKMWNVITDGGQSTDAETIFQYKKWSNSNNDNICKLFKSNFKTSLINSEDPNRKTLKNEGITPHILRHARAYDVLVNHHLDKSDVIKMFGWSNDTMIYHYADINTMLSKEAQLERFKNAGILTDLKIDSAKLWMGGR